MILPTDGKGSERTVFEEKLEERIYVLADSYQPKRVGIGVQSFGHDVKNGDGEQQNTLCLLEKFEHRHLKEKYNWNEDIFTCLHEFLLSSTYDKQAYQIVLDTHLLIAFAAGMVLHSKSGVNIFPIQKHPKMATCCGMQNV